MLQPHRETFNDGFMSYGHKTTQRSDNRKRIGSVFNPEGKLAYKEISTRDRDYQFAGYAGAKLDLKIKTPYPPSFRSINKNKLKVVIGNIEYDVIDVDPDNRNKFLYFYLQEVGGHSE